MQNGQIVTIRKNIGNSKRKRDIEMFKEETEETKASTVTSKKQ